MATDNNNEQPVPCNNCIVLPKCIQRLETIIEVHHKKTFYSNQ